MDFGPLCAVVGSDRRKRLSEKKKLYSFFVFSGKGGRHTGDPGQLLAVFHQQGEVLDQDGAVLLSGGQHHTGAGQTVPGPGQLHVHRLVLRVAQRGAGVRVPQVSERFARAVAQADEAGVAVHGPRAQLGEPHVAKVPDQRPPVQLHDAQVVFGTDHSLHEPVAVQDERHQARHTPVSDRHQAADILCRSSEWENGRRHLSLRSYRSRGSLLPTL